MDVLETLSFPLRVASIDVGSNAIRLLVAEFKDASTYSTLAYDRVAVRLAHGVFVSGRLADDAMDAAVRGLQTFHQQLDSLGVKHYRAVGTSAVRESSNGERFVERVRKEALINLDVITGFEEARLVHLAVRHKLPLGRKLWVLADVGGGSVEVSLVDDHGILWSETHTMGSVRLVEELTSSGAEPGRFSRLLEEYVSTLRIPSGLRRRAPAGLIATGGGIGTLARLVGDAPDNGGVSVLHLEQLGAIIQRMSRLSYRQRVDELGLREDRADVILPAAMMYERLAQLAGTQQILVPNVGVREGVALDLVEDLTTHRAHQDRQTAELMSGAISLGARYMFDENHGVHVAELALSLFDQLRDQHRLGDGDRSLLLAAGVLHDIGQYVSNEGHHKHSLYLLTNSDLSGLTERQMLLVANIARYHRKSEPAAHHESFAKLADAEQGRVRRLAAILRLADALDRDHLQRIKRVTATVTKGELVLRLEAPGDLLLERWALQRKADFFAKVFGLKVHVVARAEAT